MNKNDWIAQKLIDYQKSHPDSKIVTIRLAERLQEYLDDCEYRLKQQILDELTEFNQENYDRIRDETNRQ